MRKIAIPIVALLVLVAGSVALASTGLRDTEHASLIGKVGILDTVLGDLVEDGTLTQQQSDAIVTALEEAKADALAAVGEARAQLESAWEDGVLTSEEIAGLPFGDWITDPDGPLSEALADGQITKEELNELAGSRHGHFGRTRGWRHGGHGDHGHRGLWGLKGLHDSTSGVSV